MDRAEFMRRLSALLQDVPPAEREEALQYYNDYFDDAGEGSEAGVIASLGTPEELAKSIKAGLADGGSAGEFTESGFRGYEQGNRYQVMSTNETGDDTKEGAQQSGFADSFGGQQNSAGGAYGSYGQQDSTGSTYGAYGQQNSTGNTYGAYGQQTNDAGNMGGRSKSSLSGEQIALIVVLAVLTSPVWIGLLGGLFGCVVGLFVALLGIFIAFLAVGVVFMAVGVWLFISGIATLFSAPLTGLSLVGVGLILIALGLVFMCLMVWTVGSAAPALIRGCVNLCRRIFHSKGEKV